MASIPEDSPSGEQQQPHSGQDQLQNAAVTSSPRLQEQPVSLANGANGNGANSNGNDPFQCLWSGCRERTQSAEALYVRYANLPTLVATDDPAGPRLREPYWAQEHQ